MRRLLIIGCGDVGVRLIPLARPRYRVLALTRDRSQCASLRALGATPIFGDLDQPQTLSVLAGIAHDIVHLAPPPAVGATDTRTAHLIAALANRGSSRGSTGRGVHGRKAKNIQNSLPQHFIYISTSGVYGDCGGEIVPETRPAQPQTARAQLRVDAERRLRAWGVDLVADRHGLQRPPRVARSEAARVIPENLLSFMSESRRLSNHRIKRELRFRLRYPSVHDGIADLRIPGT